MPANTYIVHGSQTEPPPPFFATTCPIPAQQLNETEPQKTRQTAIDKAADTSNPNATCAGPIMPMYKSSGPQDEKSDEDENGGGIERKGNGERGENDDDENVRHAQTKTTIPEHATRGGERS
ncbi:hypothetical protein PAXINDRAFT_100802 [Paxillus involutus ATCC 200175]|uniref:Uncharacterized protein n=1 Tax=Paxillus involutus ATCC 200175 TaxID=664439 RepID=A0A0C9TS68_PAXIN|nr:hypothetical protein PAXINDRAFT_100802 [Paxillus involutus ATCC 200175]